MIGRVASLVVAAAALLIMAPGEVAAVDPPFPAERAAAPDARGDRVEQARRQALDDIFQAELPRYRTGSGAERDPTVRPGRRAGELDASDRNRRRFDAREREQPGAMSSLIRMLMWGMVIVIVVLGAFWLVSEMSKFGGDAELPSENEPDAGMRAAVDAITERPLGDADELARRGLFAEAIHTLLLRTLQELVRGAAVRVAPATTSREILARVPLLADARTALSGLITAVELTHFGDDPASAADYEHCRQQFHVFAEAFRHGRQVGRQAVAA